MRHAACIMMMLGVLFAGILTPACAQESVVTYWNELAHYLAGMPLEAGSPFQKLAGEKHYQEHRIKMNEFWDRVEKENIARIAPWRDKNIYPSFNRATVFYPLCGGDFVNMYTFYPAARRYIMVSAEPAGKIPTPLMLTEGEIKNGFQSVRGVISSIASVNYFVTKAMRYEMKNPYMGGTLPVYLVFAARLNLRVTNIQPVGISKNGVLSVLDAAGKIGGEVPPIPGNRITFTAPGDSTQREIIYLSMRLAPNSMDPNTPEGKFFSTLSGLNVLIKSAVYLFHDAGFRDLAAFILARTNLLIQDDSGIPFRYFDRNAFDISLFGHFDTPVRLVEIPRPPLQPDLAQAFKDQSRPLPFHFGYGVLRRDRVSNLLMATSRRK